MRLRIGKNGQYLDLRRGTSVQLDMTSPLYFAENRGSVFPSVKTYSFGVPDTAHNRLMLNRPAELDNPTPFIDESGWVIEFDGYIILEGKLEVEDGVHESDIKITFIGGLAGNLEALKTLNLRDLPLSSISLGSTPAEALTTLAEWVDDTEADYVLPMIRVNATGELQDNTDDDTDNPTPTVYTFLNYYRAGAFLLSDDDQAFPSPGDSFPFESTMAPMPWLRDILELALAQVQYSLSGVFDSHTLADELNKLIIFSNYTLDEQVSQPSTGDLSFENVAINTTYHPARSLPNIKAADLIKAICNLFCLAPVLDATGSRLILVACPDTLDPLPSKNWTAKVDPRFLRGRPLEDIPQEFRYEDPSEGYSSSRTRLFRLSEVDYSFETAADAEAALTVDDEFLLIYIAELNEFFYTRKATLNSGPDVIEYLFLFPRGKDLGVINEGGVPSYSPNCTTLHTITRTDINGSPTGEVLFYNGSDVADGPRLSTAFYGDLQTPLQEGSPLEELIFLLYRGLVTARDGDKVPHAGSGLYNYNGSQIGQMSLHWSGNFGLYEKWWRKWMEALQAMRPVSYPTRLTAIDLSQLDWTKKVLIDKHPYFIKKIQVTLTTDTILSANVEYMQIN